MQESRKLYGCHLERHELGIISILGANFILCADCTIWSYLHRVSPTGGNIAFDRFYIKTKDGFSPIEIDDLFLCLAQSQIESQIEAGKLDDEWNHFCKEVFSE